MKDRETLRNILRPLNGKDYGAYQGLVGQYDYDFFKLFIDQIPKDPYAPPHVGIYVVQVQQEDKALINPIIHSKTKEIAFRDFIARKFYAATEQVSKGRRGTGYSGVITIDEPGQAVLERSSVVVNRESIEVRFFMGLPAHGRKIDIKIAEKMFFNELPKIVELALSTDNLDLEGLQRHIDTVEDAESIRAQLDPMGLVAFVCENTILPRESGTSDKPLSSNKAVPFHTPDSLKIEIKLPRGNKIIGMGIPKGVTLIARETAEKNVYLIQKRLK
jgi:predicted ABC-class ATPase